MDPRAQLCVTRNWVELASVTEPLTNALFASAIIFARVDFFLFYSYLIGYVNVIIKTLIVSCNGFLFLHECEIAFELTWILNIVFLGTYDATEI